jgi:hypothetical protein
MSWLRHHDNIIRGGESSIEIAFNEQMRFAAKMVFAASHSSGLLAAKLTLLYSVIYLSGDVVDAIENLVILCTN